MDYTIKPVSVLTNPFKALFGIFLEQRSERRLSRTTHAHQSNSVIVSLEVTIILCNKLKCLLCSSASIGRAPINRYTAQVAVLNGSD